MSSRKAFTLIELLIVIAIIAILSVVVVLTLNPSAMLQQSRDQNRLSDMDTLVHALAVTQTDTNPISLGTSSIVSVSLPDPAATTTAGSNCASLGLPVLPTGYTYHCAGPSYYRNTNGTGWLGVNFSGYSLGSPLGSLPVDPLNSSSSRLYYTYTTNGTSYEVTSVMESSKYRLGGTNDVISPDGGTLASVYEKGSQLGLEPLDYGDPSLVGLWTFQEGSNSIAYDYSGQHATGNWSGSQVGTNGYYSPGKIGPWTGTFDGSSTYVRLPSVATIMPSLSSGVTMCAWIKSSSLGSGMSSAGVVSLGYDLNLYISNTGQLVLARGGTVSGGSLFDNNFHHACGTYDGAYAKLYIDGVLVISTAESWSSVWVWPAEVSAIGQNQNNGVASRFSGLIDDVRIYNRALSAAQISAMYAGGK
jgi:prepilin-type N-terminal cleavage/methylation domain-containing protein